MRVLNESARVIWIRLPALPGAVVVTDPDDPENKVPVGPVSDMLEPGEVSPEYPEHYRELLLSTAGLRECSEAMQADVPQAIEKEIPAPVTQTEEPEVTPMKPKKKPSSAKTDSRRRRK